MTVSRLSPEILERIFYQLTDDPPLLDSSTPFAAIEKPQQSPSPEHLTVLRSAPYVSKSWHLAAQHPLWHCLYIRSHSQIQRILHILANPMHSSPTPQLTVLITVTLDDSIMEKGVADLVSLLRHTPNIVSLTFVVPPLARNRPAWLPAPIVRLITEQHFPRLKTLILGGPNILVHAYDLLLIGQDCITLEHLHLTDFDVLHSRPNHGFIFKPLPPPDNPASFSPATNLTTFGLAEETKFFRSLKTFSLGTSAEFMARPYIHSFQFLRAMFTSQGSLGRLHRLNLMIRHDYEETPVFLNDHFGPITALEISTSSALILRLRYARHLANLTLHLDLTVAPLPSHPSLQRITIVHSRRDDPTLSSSWRTRTNSLLEFIFLASSASPLLSTVEYKAPLVIRSGGTSLFFAHWQTVFQNRGITFSVQYS